MYPIFPNIYINDNSKIVQTFFKCVYYIYLMHLLRVYIYIYIYSIQYTYIYQLTCCSTLSTPSSHGHVYVSHLNREVKRMFREWDFQYTDPY